MWLKRVMEFKGILKFRKRRTQWGGKVLVGMREAAGSDAKCWKGFLGLCTRVMVGYD